MAANSELKSQRIIERHEYAQALQRNREALKNHPEIYKQRQAIVEHPFGTMKRQWGFDHIITKKTKERASSDVGFIFTAYNLRRIINIVGVVKLGAYLREALLFFLALIFTPKSQISFTQLEKIIKENINYYFDFTQKGLFLVKI